MDPLQAIATRGRARRPEGARMVPLNRPTRQVLATAVLFGLSVVPTAWIAAMAWRINHPGYVREVEVGLGRQLGLSVSLESVRHPRPGEVCYRGVVLRQQEPRGGGGSEIARADEARLHWGDRELTLVLENAHLRAESPGQAMDLLGGFLQRPGPIPFDRINLTAPTCALDLGRQDLRFSAREVAGEFLADTSAPAVRLAYRISAGPAPGPRRVARPGPGTHCELTLARDRRAETPVTTLAFRTVEGLPLPARVLSPFFPTEEWLGAAATVEGLLELRRAGSRDWEAAFSGSLHDIELAGLVGRRFPRHRLAGRARLLITTARWGPRPGQGPGWIEARGELLSGRGAIGVPLLEAMAREMRFRLSPRLSHRDPRRTEVDFDALGLAFEMRADGEIRLAGALGAEAPHDAVLAGATGPIASAPQGSASVHGLIKTLFPVADASPGVMVPLTTESSVLLALPVPPGTPATVRRPAAGN
jgi:hypothetical protein